MNADDILDEVSTGTGWDEASKLALALEYINRQQDNAAWRDFLQVAAEEEDL